MTKTTSDTSATTRKPSWQYDDLAQKIQVASRRIAAKLVLRHLASKADDAGVSYHGYKSIAVYCSLAERQIAPALRYLRDELKVVTWMSGKGGTQYGTNRYVLNLAAMKRVVAEQGVFDPETGKIIRSNSVQRLSSDSVQRTSSNTVATAFNAQGKAEATALNDVSDCVQRLQTPIEPPKKNKPPSHTSDGKDFSFGDTGQLPEGFIRDGDTFILAPGWEIVAGVPTRTGGVQ